MFYFEPFTTVPYDIRKNGFFVDVTNLFLRYKVLDVFKNQSAVYYDYNIKDGERPDVIAAKYYEDAALDWIILITNNIIDPQFDWPLDLKAFEKYIIKKHGSITAAKEAIQRYEQIGQEHEVLFDGTVVQEQKWEIDLDTYNSLPDSEKRIVTCYEHEEEVNEAKRNIKILSEEYVFEVVNQVREVFDNV